MPSTEVQKSLPPDVKIKTAYDRTSLIERAIETLRHTLTEESVNVSIIIILFLFHARSALVAILTIPMAILMSFTIMYFQGLGKNIMSLGGIAIAIGAMVDASIIMVENVHKHFEHDTEGKPHWDLIRDAAVEVGPTLFFALLVITISFMPIFTLEAQEGRLFKPLAFTKTYAMGASVFLAITISPLLANVFIRNSILPNRWSRSRRLLTIWLVPFFVFISILLFTHSYRADSEPFWLGLSIWSWIAIISGVLLFITLMPQKLHPEEQNPVNRILIGLYHPVLEWILHRSKACWGIIVAAILVILSIIYPYQHIGSEFMPPLYEGDLLYMPTTLPGIGITKARKLLQQTDKIIASFPEVHHVSGKIGRADTATDPAPLTMIETTIMLKPEEEWPEVDVVDDTGKVIAHRQRTPDELVAAMNREIKFPGVTNAWTMPIKTRIDMLYPFTAYKSN